MNLGGSMLKTKLLGIAILTLAAGCAAVPQSQSGSIVMEEAMVPSDPGISVYVRNKRPAGTTAFSPEKTVLYVHGEIGRAHV